MSISLHRPHGSRGFTLLEILCAVTVLTLMLVLVNQLTLSAMAVMSLSGRHIDSDTEARLIFNRMAVDFSRMLKRTDIDYSPFKQPSNPLPGNDQFALYSETSGYFSGTSQPAGTGRGDVSLVAYRVANDPTTGSPGLHRMGKGLGWEPDPGGTAWSNVAFLPVTINDRWPNLFTGDTDYRPIGEQVFRMEYTYLLKSTATQAARTSITPWDATTHTSVNGFKDVAAIIVTIAILDNSSRLLVKNFNDLAQPFSDAKDGTDTCSTWNAVVNSATFSTIANVSKPSAAGVRIYQRYFYLDSPL